MVPLTAEYVRDELNHRIGLPRPRETSCFALKHSRGEVFVSRFPGCRVVLFRRLEIFAQILKLAAFTPFLIELAGITPARRRHVRVKNASLSVEDDHAVGGPRQDSFGEGRRCRSGRGKSL